MFVLIYLFSRSEPWLLFWGITLFAWKACGCIMSVLIIFCTYIMRTLRHYRKIFAMNVCTNPSYILDFPSSLAVAHTTAGLSWDFEWWNWIFWASQVMKSNTPTPRTLWFPKVLSSVPGEMFFFCMALDRLWAHLTKEKNAHVTPETCMAEFLHILSIQHIPHSVLDFQCRLRSPPPDCHVSSKVSDGKLIDDKMNGLAFTLVWLG